MEIKAGTYYGRGVDIEFGVAGTGTEQVAVRFRFEGGPSDGQMMPWFGSFADAAQKRTLEALRYCGWDTDDLGDLSPEVIGRNLVQLVVQEDEYQGKRRMRIAWVNRAGGPLVKNAMNDAEKRAFFQRMKGEASQIDKGLAASSGAKAPPSSNGRGAAAQSGAQDFEDAPFDDIDF